MNYTKMDVPTTNLPDTQNCDEIVYSQDDANVGWGWLYALKANFDSLELLRDEYTVGRATTCDVVISTTQVKEEILVTFSKLHFQIRREIVNNTPIVYLEDLSFNGTHINGDKVGKGNKIVLQNNDQISLANPHYKVFVFMDTATCDTSNNYAEDVKRQYVISRSLGVGAFGEVLLVFERKTSKRFAMKIVQKKKLSGNTRLVVNDPEKIMNEVNILKALRHPCIIQVYEIFDTPDRVYIILELMDGGELFNRIDSKKQLSETETKWIFYQIVFAVQYLHAQGITHRDLKPENILLASDEQETIVKVSDFGLSKFVDSQIMMTTFCGTPLYVAPEVLETRGRGSYTSQVDVWSLGVILYVCLSGQTPFSSDYKNLTLQEQICSGCYTFTSKSWQGVSQNAIDLIKKMMTVNPKKRITINKIPLHPWLQDEAMTKKIHHLLKSQYADENKASHKGLQPQYQDENDPPLKRSKYHDDTVQ